MKLRDLIAPLKGALTQGSTDLEIGAIRASSREVAKGELFVAIAGDKHDGHQFIGDALKAGAVAIVAEKPAPDELDSSVAWVQVKDSRLALAEMATVFHGDPASALALAGVTGTNGKTTTSFLIHHIMKTAWHQAGLLGTILVDDGRSTHKATHTTPDALALTEWLSRIADNGCRGAAMEVSSHGIHQQRVAATGFDACVFTNLSQDHLDYHGSMEDYFQAKADWFEALAANPRGKKPVAVINIDDARGLKLADRLAEKGMKVTRFGYGVHCDFRINNLRQSPRGMEFELKTPSKQLLVRAPYIGRFNVYNVVAAIAAAQACGIKPREAVAALADAPQVPGRMQLVGSAGGASVFIDYAHTPDALENACQAIKELDPRNLITVFGCGGDRDTGKRPLMAKAAARHSDALVITSDNPRSEDPEAIIKQIEAGLKGSAHISITDRAEAIDHAIANARSGDIVLIAGKGHETTQTLATETIEFDDRKVASKALRDRSESISQNR
ncbi:MAG: UDP-N-acetylmuramoyl-L-alanyl-D-glutamate--2,6-diaminopimelate ligase [Akkermansiaceae bacterium]|nr:UDP-N-acetylmuramoyl-L-alanyl-D-glutamate--2,6-diaminopimelate ligase [Akkermansiaceae bacterium]